MNVFVLSTGRCGSLTFAKACESIRNFTTKHESGWGREDRLAYSDNHIEVDNRLSWFLGSLDERYGNDVFYVHLVRDAEVVAGSFLRRWGTGIIECFQREMLGSHTGKPLEACRCYVETVNKNIECFLHEKINALRISIETPQENFARFWNMIKAEGNMDEALHRLREHHNRSL